MRAMMGLTVGYFPPSAIFVGSLFRQNFVAISGFWVQLRQVLKKSGARLCASSTSRQQASNLETSRTLRLVFDTAALRF